MTTAFNISSTSSGLDVTSIVDNLVKAQSTNVSKAQKRQAAFKSQISQVARLTSAMSAFKTAAASLKNSGSLGVVQSGTTTGFSATPTSSANAGNYTVSVDALARAPKARTVAFGSPTDVVKAGTLNFSINGTSTDVTLTDGMTLQEAAQAINDSGAAVNANVLSSNGTAYLSITGKDTGFTVGGQPDDALRITETSTGSTGTALGITTTQPATNSKVTIDGLQFERMSNVVDDALPGVALNLTAVSGLDQDLKLTNDTAATKKNLQGFVDAYNSVMTVLHDNLDIQEATDRTYTLGGDSSIRALQSQMMSIVSAVTGSSSSVRTLADIGIKSGNDGTLSIDDARLTKAIASDASAINNLFQRADTGVSAQFAKLIESYTNSTDGVLVTKNKSFNDSVKLLDSQITTLQSRLDSYRTRLINQFTSMETTVSGFKSLGNYLTAQSKADNSSS